MPSEGILCEVEKAIGVLPEVTAEDVRQETIRILASCVAYSLAPVIEVTCSSEMSVDFQRTTWHYIPEARTLLTEEKFVKVCCRPKMRNSPKL
jgi:hypothetical protein